MHPVLFSFGPVTIYTFGLLALLGFLAASFVVWKRGKEAHFVEEEVLDATVLVTLAGIVGARVAYILFNQERFGFSPLAWLALIRYPGLSFYGGLVGGMLALWLIARRKRWEFLTISDIAVTGLSLAQAIGWIGAFFSGFGMGREVRSLGMIFPGEEVRRFPLQFVWAIGFLVLFIFLWRMEERYRTLDWYRGKRAAAQTGFLTFSYFTGLGLIGLFVALFAEARVYWSWLQIGLGAALGWLVLGISGFYWRSGRSLREDGKKSFAGFGSRSRQTSVWLRQQIRRRRYKPTSRNL